MPESPTLALRRASSADSAMIWRWRNDARVRAVSTNADEIAWPQHETWFARAIADEARLLLVAIEGDAAVGFVRFDRADQDAIVSIFTDPDRMGRGLGAPMLQAGEARATHAWPGLRRFVATIRTDNLRSQRAFVKAGYRQEASQWIKDIG